MKKIHTRELAISQLSKRLRKIRCTECLHLFNNSAAIGKATRGPAAMPPNNRENKIPYIPDFSPIYFMSVSFSPTDQVALQIVRQGEEKQHI